MAQQSKLHKASPFSLSSPTTLLLGFLVLTISTLAAYWPATEAGFIMDDKKFFINDPVMTASDGLMRIWFHPEENNEAWPIIPITRTIFWLESQIWGIDLQVTHWINILLHLMGATLLWGGLQHLQFRGAWFVGMLFALHPIHVQSVAWISERKNVVVAIFYLLCLWCYILYEKKQTWRWYGLALFLFVCALLSKTTTVMLPAVLILARLWFKAPWKSADLLRLVPFFLLSIGAAYLRIWVEAHSFGAVDSQVSDHFYERLLIAGHIPFFYLNKLFFPYPLIANYPKWEIDSGQIISYLPLLSLVLIAGILLWKYRTWGRPLFLGLGIFLMLLFPVLSFFNNSWFQYSFVANHWVHLPSITILLLGVQGGLWIRDTIKKKYQRGYQPLMLTVGGLVFLGLGLMTWAQAQTYKNHETLGQAIIAQNPDSWLAHFNLGAIYLDQKRFSLALEHFSKTIELKNNFVGAYNNRGIVYLNLGEFERAIADYNRILEINPQDIGAFNHRGVAYFRLQNFEQALQDYDQAIALQPDHANSYNNRGNILSFLGRYQEAIDDFTQTIALDPNFVAAYRNRGISLAQLQQHEAALQDFNKAIALQPNAAILYFNRALSHTALGHYPDALTDYSQAIQLEPQSVSAYVNRGMLYQQYFTKPQEACQDWQHACALGDCQFYQQAQQQGVCE